MTEAAPVRAAPKGPLRRSTPAYRPPTPLSDWLAAASNATIAVGHAILALVQKFDDGLNVFTDH
jgi:hypothetical protein